MLQTGRSQHPETRVDKCVSLVFSTDSRTVIRHRSHRGALYTIAKTSFKVFTGLRKHIARRTITHFAWQWGRMCSLRGHNGGQTPKKSKNTINFQ
jgi:hypothetical protein